MAYWDFTGPRPSGTRGALVKKLSNSPVRILLWFLNLEVVWGAQNQKMAIKLQPWVIVAIALIAGKRTALDFDKAVGRQCG
jgi:hypothetical protein